MVGERQPPILYLYYHIVDNNLNMVSMGTKKAQVRTEHYNVAPRFRGSLHGYF